MNSSRAVLNENGWSTFLVSEGDSLRQQWREGGTILYEEIGDLLFKDMLADGEETLLDLSYK